MSVPVLDRSSAEGLGRDDPGAVLPQRFEDVANAGDAAEVRLVGRRSTAWCSAADARPPTLLPAELGARGPEVAAVAAVADELRAVLAGDTVTYVRRRNINYTNLCTFKCASARSPRGR